MDPSSVEIHNPAYAGPSDEGLQRLPFPQLEQGSALKLGLLNNKKPNGTELLAAVEERLSTIFDVDARTFTKGDGAHGAPPEMIRELADFADVAITATCD